MDSIAPAQLDVIYAEDGFVVQERVESQPSIESNHWFQEPNQHTDNIVDVTDGASKEVGIGDGAAGKEQKLGISLEFQVLAVPGHYGRTVEEEGGAGR